MEVVILYLFWDLIYYYVLCMLATYLKTRLLADLINTYIENTRWVPFDIKFTRQDLLGDSTSVLKAESGKLDIQTHETGILFISLPIVSLFKLAIMT